MAQAFVFSDRLLEKRGLVETQAEQSACIGRIRELGVHDMVLDVEAADFSFVSAA
jgi:hypothetical protein